MKKIRVLKQNKRTNKNTNNYQRHVDSFKDVNRRSKKQEKIHWSVIHFRSNHITRKQVEKSVPFNKNQNKNKHFSIPFSYTKTHMTATTSRSTPNVLGHRRWLTSRIHERSTNKGDKMRIQAYLGTVGTNWFSTPEINSACTTWVPICEAITAKFARNTPAARNFEKRRKNKLTNKQTHWRKQEMMQMKTNKQNQIKKEKQNNSQNKNPSIKCTTSTHWSKTKTVSH